MRDFTIVGTRRLAEARDRAYRVKGSDIPGDLQAAIDAEPRAKAMLEKPTAQNRSALIFRLGNIRTEAGRAKKIADFVAMLMARRDLSPPESEVTAMQSGFNRWAR